MESEGFVLLASPRESLAKSTSSKAPNHDTPETKSCMQYVSLRVTGRCFTNLGLDDWLERVLSGLSIRFPSPVQEACVPSLIHRQDTVASAKTGSGKTLAFALPILHHLSRAPHGFFAVVLTPTR